MFAVAVQGLRYLSEWRPAGCWLAGIGLILCLAAFASEFWTLVKQDRASATQWFARRARFQATLQEDGKSLVIVRYGRPHRFANEWVYNDADIDRAPVVWAREMDDAQNRKLLDYFRDRRAWLLEADAPSPELMPYVIASPKE